MPGTITNALGGEVVLHFDSCTTFGQAFDDRSGVLIPNVLNAPLALDTLFGECGDPGTQLKGKIAVFIQDSARLCVKTTRDQWTAYAQALEAGAVGILHINPMTSTYPGQWYGDYYNGEAARKYGEEFLTTKRIPFVTCAATNVGSQTIESANATVSDQASISNFTMLMEMIGGASELYPNGLNASITVSANEWDLLFQSIPYKIIFQGVISLFYWATFILGIYFTYERVYATVSNARQRGTSPVWDVLTNVPVIALVIETLSCMLLGIYFCVDAQWSVYGSLFASTRSVFSGMLIMATVASSTLVGLSFYDFKRNTKRMRMGNDSALRNYRWILATLAGVFFTMEVLLAVLRENPTVFRYVAAASSLMAIGCSIWLAVQGYSFASFVSRLGMSSPASNRGRGGSLWQVQRHTTRWVTVSSVALVLEVTMLSVVIISPRITDSPDRYFGYWFITGYFRALLSLSKIYLCRIQLTKKKRSTLGGLSRVAMPYSNTKWTTSRPGTTTLMQSTSKGSQHVTVSSFYQPKSVVSLDEEVENRKESFELSELVRHDTISEELDMALSKHITQGPSTSLGKISVTRDPSKKLDKSIIPLPPPPPDEWFPDPDI